MRIRHLWRTANRPSPASLQHLSGERLLLLRIFGDERTGQMVERELDRRATAQLADRTLEACYGPDSPAVA